MDGKLSVDDTKDEDDTDDESFVHPATNPVKADTLDKKYWFMDWEDDKPCLHIKFLHEDQRRRLYLSNMVQKIYDKLVMLVLINVTIISTAILFEGIFASVPFRGCIELSPMSSCTATR